MDRHSLNAMDITDNFEFHCVSISSHWIEKGDRLVFLNLPKSSQSRFSAPDRSMPALQLTFHTPIERPSEAAAAWIASRGT